jgi:hypothetical protein
MLRSNHLCWSVIKECAMQVIGDALSTPGEKHSVDFSPREAQCSLVHNLQKTPCCYLCEHPLKWSRMPSILFYNWPLVSSKNSSSALYDSLPFQVLLNFAWHILNPTCNARLTSWTLSYCINSPLVGFSPLHPFTPQIPHYHKSDVNFIK